MIYLMNFQMPTREDEENYFSDKDNIKVKKTCYTTYYPFQLFRYRELPEFFFSDITIFCGNNGSGKSSILNIIAEFNVIRTADSSH